MTLIERLEALDGPDREVDAEIADQLDIMMPYGVDIEGDCAGRKNAQVYHKDEAIAICIAALKAWEIEEKDDE